ncbi:MAG: MFS transporter [Paracoccaceae bacterium]|nr:MFS transporter [Paracoccaceae bacterium]MDE2915051.1 MFS transporter [Paracoccaceae bacterium]
MKNRALPTWFTLGHFANDWSVCSLWLIVPAVGVAMNLSPADVGLLFTICYVGGALAYLPAGILADHVSNRGRLLLATFWWVTVGYLLAAMAPGFWSLALLLAIAGMGDAAWHPIATGVLTRENKDRRAHVLGIHAIGGSLAEVLSPLSVGFLLAYVDWREALAISVLPAAFMGLCFFWVVRAVPRVEKKSVSKQDMFDLLNAWRQGNGLRMVAMICLYNMALMALLSMIPFYLADRHGFGPLAAGIVFSAMLIVGALTQPWIGKISDTAGRRPVLVSGNLTAAMAIGLLVFQPSLWAMIAAMMVAVAALAAIRAAVLAGAVDHTGHSEGTTLGFAFALLEGIGALGAVFAGIAAGISWPHMFGLAATFALVAAALGSVTVFRESVASVTTESDEHAEDSW